MIDAVVGWYGRQGKRVHAFEATNVVAILAGIRPTLMMRVDAAVRAEIVLRGLGVELIELQGFLAFNNF